MAASPRQAPASSGNSASVSPSRWTPAACRTSYNASGFASQQNRLPRPGAQHDHATHRNPVTDLNVWLAAFDRMAEARTNAGVTAQRVLHLVDDPNYIFVDLDFTTTEEAQSFLTFLKTTVWSSKDNAPALAGTPQTKLLQQATAR